MKSIKSTKKQRSYLYGRVSDQSPGNTPRPLCYYYKKEAS